MALICLQRAAVVEDVEISYLIKSLNFVGPKVTRLSPKQIFSYVLTAKSEDCQTCHKLVFILSCPFENTFQHFIAWHIASSFEDVLFDLNFHPHLTANCKAYLHLLTRFVNLFVIVFHQQDMKPFHIDRELESPMTYTVLECPILFHSAYR